ncbi:hypothetical protein [Pseudoclavibacter sp. AY1H1]|uniref:hypothetical protein n=1 Tax=Pseudoclavibacter sp. AY1H1 TaxID=2080584 RepID=UPI000CE868E5|nr:hypothetical protein [Pseudoclavibacter sp. AY1H1]PPF39945.1 hypothetical protein C5E05_01665 [Pseudoclavibacter sp. AY1H1]
MSQQTAETIADIERIVLASGQCVRTAEVEFSQDGATWSPVFAKTDDSPVPAFIRASAQRAGTTEPTVVFLSWEEAIPADDEYHGLWMRRPMALAGARARRDVYRRAFRDLVDIVPNPAEGDDPDIDRAAAPAEEPAPRDWVAELTNAQTLDELREVHHAAKKARAVKTAEFKAWKVRKAELEAPLKEAVERIVDTMPGLEKPAERGSVGVALEAALDEAQARRVPTPLEAMRGRR